ncbi:MAG: p-hydroxycinnamoyl CoA hydratase/lyase [Candidatus Methylomirabilales bacterium]
MTSKTYETVLVEKEGPITWVILNRPEKRNAMNPQLCFDMVDILSELDTDPECRVMVLTGKGESFSAGMDIREFFRALDDKPAEQARAREAERRWGWQKLTNFSKPTIAMVNGYCFGGAFIPLVACDFAIAAHEATFGLSEINWGIIPGGLVSKVVTETMNYRKALYYACTGRTFDGKEAEAIGLVTYAVPLAELRNEVIGLAGELLEKSPAVLRATKEVIKGVRDMSVEQAYDYIAAKQEQARFRDAEKTRARGMSEFLDSKSYRPGLGPVKRPG